MTLFSFLLIIFFGALELCAQDYDLGNIVVESNKMDQSWYESGTSSMIISSDMVENEDRFLEALSAGGVEVVQNGANGNASIHLRGLESRHTVVMVDGFPINDVSNPSGNFNASYLKNLNIEKIEILRGPQSVLHSGALGGVVNIITKKVASDNKLYVGAGNYEYNNLGVVSSNDFMGPVYHFTADYEELDGLSSAKGGSEEDQYHNLSGTLSAMYDLSPKLFGRTLIMHNQVNEDFDGGAFSDNDDNFVRSKQLLAAQKFELQITQNLINETDLSLNRNRRQYQGTFVDDIQGSQYRIESRFLKKMGQGKILFGFTGIENQVNSNKLDKGIYQFDLFSKLDFEINNYGFELGFRHVSHEKFDSLLLYQASFYRNFGHFKVGGNIGTSFRAPSVSELYGFGGNAELDPEYAQSMDIFMKRKLKNGYYNLSIFKQEVQDSIEYLSVSPFTGFNSGSYQSEGVEFELAQNFYGFKNNFSLSYHDLNNAKDERPLYRAYFRYAYFLQYEYKEMQTYGLKYGYTGERLGSSSVKLSDYHLWDLSFAQKLEKLTLKISINNIFDEDYQETLGYSVLRRNYRAELSYYF